MPFFESDEPAISLLALPEGLDLDPDQPDPTMSLMEAAFKRENPIGSLLSNDDWRSDEPFDPDYRPWNDIQGTVYEGFSDRFLGVRNAKDVAALKAQIDTELEQRRTIDAAGGWGVLAEMAAGVLSPSSLLPGGAVVKGVKGGVSIGRTAMSVAAWSAAATAMDELALQSSQEARTGAESAYAIGGSVILGGLLGSAAGAMTRKAFDRAALSVEQLPQTMYEFNDDVRSLSAADPNASTKLSGVIEKWNKMPVLRTLLRTDPLLRTQVSSNTEVRRATAKLNDTVLQYEVNETGQTIAPLSVEGIIKVRRNTELAKLQSNLSSSYAEYFNDGTVGTIGRLTAPITARWQHLIGYDGKLNRQQYLDEIGKAVVSADTHPIPQIAKATEEVRNFFEEAANDLKDVGIFSGDITREEARRYLTRVYIDDKIRAHFWDGSENDLATALKHYFEREQREAAARLENDRTVDQMEGELMQLKEQASQAKIALRKATKKAQAKKGRAEAAAKRESAVARASSGLRKQFERRQRALLQKTAKGYVPAKSEAWRNAEILATDEAGAGMMVKAGDVYDAIDARQRAARELLECLGG